MDTEELRLKQASFEGNRQERLNYYKELKKLQELFTKKFPIERLKTLGIDDYVEGKKINGEVNTETFCYWVEWKTSELGRMQGARADKFGLYCNKKTQEYVFLKNFKDERQALEFLRREMLKLLEYGKNKDLEGIKKIKLSPMFKGKILFLYYPDKFINIFAERHVDYFLEKLGLLDENTKNIDLIDKREILFNFKNQDEIMNEWSMYEFSDFLYTIFGRPINKNKTHERLRKYIDFEEDYPKISRVKADFIDLNVISKEPLKVPHKPNQAPRIIDFEKENRRNKRLGDRGELIVLRKEKTYLKENGRHDLAKKIEHVSKKDTNAGYDILSFELNGEEKFIEVKSTASSFKNIANFILTSNEYDKAQRLKNYYIYIVFEAKSENPKIWRIKDPIALKDKGLKMSPLSFRVVINIENKNGETN